MGTVAFVLSQVAYRCGPLAASLPALTLTDPVASIAVRISLFSEQLTGATAAHALQAAALVVTFTAVIALARTQDTPAVLVAPAGRRSVAG